MVGGMCFGGRVRGDWLGIKDGGEVVGFVFGLSSSGRVVERLLRWCRWF